MILINISMLILPPILAWMIHIYLRHGDMSEKLKVVLLLTYFSLINLITIAVTYLRGIGGLNFNNMTLSFRIKYICFGCVLGITIPFAMCVLVKNSIIAHILSLFKCKLQGYGDTIKIEIFIRQIINKLEIKNIFLYLIFLFLMIFTIANKENYHVDEMYSYGLSNNVGSISISIEEGKKYDSAEPYLKYLTVSKENRFDFAKTNNLQIVMDTYPQLKQFEEIGSFAYATTYYLYAN